MTGPTSPLLEVRNLRTVYRLRRGIVRAVDGVDLVVRKGERVGVVGESGSGKSTLAFSLMRLILPPGEIAEGSISLDGVDLAVLSERKLNAVRGDKIAMVYQDPMTYLNPVMRVGDQIAESLIFHQGMAREPAKAAVMRLLDRLHLPSSNKLYDAYPHQLSGGQRQRVVIGMAIACRPALLIADEPTTALDVTIQAEILTLLDELVRDLGMSLLLISHDLTVVSVLCDRVYVMYAGQVVETGPVDALYRSPKHPYTSALLGASTTLLDPRRRFVTIPGAAPDPTRLPLGCRFADRCPFRMQVCGQTPPIVPIGPDWTAACWLHAGEHPS